MIITVQYGLWCPASRESCYVLKIIGSYFSGMANKNKMPLSQSLSLQVFILNRKLLTTM